MKNRITQHLFDEGADCLGNDTNISTVSVVIGDVKRRAHRDSRGRREQVLYQTICSVQLSYNYFSSGCRMNIEGIRSLSSLCIL